MVQTPIVPATTVASGISRLPRRFCLEVELVDRAATAHGAELVMPGSNAGGEQTFPDGPFRAAPQSAELRT
jgi:hypothetical protein